MKNTSTAATENVLPNVDYMRVSEFAKFVPGVAMRTLRRWCETGMIPASKRGTGHWFVDLKALRQARVDLETAPKSFFESMMDNFEGEDE